MIKHTPEPWRLGKEYKQTKHSCGHDNCKEHPLQITGCELHAGKDNLWIADIHGEHLGISLNEFRANAKLMVAAPKLLEALKEAELYLLAIYLETKNPLDKHVLDTIKQAITKAE